ncbi:MAG: hypothetical protein OEQ13_14350 [Acidobacteriota bacterium]|nr:hypothetical protein [Acidobacteriota bacterium]
MRYESLAHNLVKAFGILTVCVIAVSAWSVPSVGTCIADCNAEHRDALQSIAGEAQAARQAANQEYLEELERIRDDDSLTAEEKQLARVAARQTFLATMAEIRAEAATNRQQANQQQRACISSCQASPTVP